MKSYAATDIMSNEMLRLYNQAKHLVNLIPDPAEDEPELRCHEVARIVSTLLDKPSGLLLEVCDGYYCRPHRARIEHSWIYLHHTDMELACILDTYAVGHVPQVVLLHTVVAENIYQMSFHRTDIRKDVIERCIKHVTNALTPNALTFAP